MSFLSEAPQEDRSTAAGGSLSRQIPAPSLPPLRSERADAIGEQLYSAIDSVFVIETSGWAAEKVERVAARLQQDRPHAERFRVAVLWIEAFTAFTMPGRYIYFSRRLLQLCRHDEVAAFVIAHEIAHHDLGHFDTLARWLPRIMGAGLANMLTVLFRRMEKVLRNAQKESDADRRAIDLCLQAGYDPRRCLLIFEILENFSLDVGAVDAALGPDDFDDERANTAVWRRRLRGAWYKIRRGYPSIRDRLLQLQCHLSERARQSA